MNKHLLNMLATWRISAILIEEEAPLNIAESVRLYLKQKALTYNERYWHINTEAPIWVQETYKAFQCFYCLSVWVGCVVALLTGVNPLYGFAYSAGAIMLRQWSTMMDSKVAK